MTDVHEPEIRSYNMSRIHSKDTKPEMAVRRFLFCQGFRYRLHVKHLPGTPDIVLPKYRTVVFIHGCFWHLHGCKYSTMPKTNKQFWENKLNRNKIRDKIVESRLNDEGWNTYTVWECELKDNRERCLERLADYIEAL